MKLLEYVWFSYLPELWQRNEQERNAAVTTAITWLSQYLQEEEFRDEPLGRKLEMQNYSDHQV